MTELRDGSRGATRYEYDTNGNQVSCVTPNGQATRRAWDAMNRVTEIVTRTPGSPIFTAELHYDRAGARRRIVEALGSGAPRDIRYSYDDQYRLTGEAWAGTSYEYRYDPAGNRVWMQRTTGGSSETTTYTHDDLNRLLESVTNGVPTRYAYDLNGNLTSKVEAGSPRVTYAWDTSNRLVSADVDGDGRPDFQAAYDYRSRRVRTVERGRSTAFRYDQGLSIQELEGNTLALELVRGTSLGVGVGGILYGDRSAAGGHEETYVFNAVGHTVALTDQSGSTLGTYLYEAFGGVVASTGSAPTNRLAYTKERSSLLGLDNHGYRYYDPATGRYVSRDPAGPDPENPVSSLNPYLHVNNNPVNEFDPVGLWSWSSFAKGFVTGLVVTAVVVAVVVAAPAVITAAATAGVISAATAATATTVVSVAATGAAVAGAAAAGYTAGQLAAELAETGDLSDASSETAGQLVGSLVAIPVGGAAGRVAGSRIAGRIARIAPSETAPGGGAAEPAASPKPTETASSSTQTAAEGSAPASAAPEGPSAEPGRYSGRYADGQRAYRTNVPRDPVTNTPTPDPAASGRHFRVQPDARDPSRIYSATEFDAAGNPIRRVDFAGRSGHPLPHEHVYDPATKGFSRVHRPLWGGPRPLFPPQFLPRWEDEKQK